MTGIVRIAHGQQEQPAGGSTSPFSICANQRNLRTIPRKVSFLIMQFYPQIAQRNADDEFSG